MKRTVTLIPIVLFAVLLVVPHADASGNMVLRGRSHRVAHRRRGTCDSETYCSTLQEKRKGEQRPIP